MRVAINMDREASLGKAYDFIVDFLVDRVYYFYVFPFYFLLVAKENDSEIYFDMLYDRALEKSKDESFVLRLESLVNIYQNEVESLRGKSDILSTLFNAEDPLAFFQEMMDKRNLRTFISFAKKEEKEIEKMVKDKSIIIEKIKGEIYLKI